MIVPYFTWLDCDRAATRPLLWIHLELTRFHSSQPESDLLTLYLSSHYSLIPLRIQKECSRQELKAGIKKEVWNKKHNLGIVSELHLPMSWELTLPRGWHFYQLLLSVQHSAFPLGLLQWAFLFTLEPDLLASSAVLLWKLYLLPLEQIGQNSPASPWLGAFQFPGGPLPHLYPCDSNILFHIKGNLMLKVRPGHQFWASLPQSQNVFQSAGEFSPICHKIY